MSVFVSVSVCESELDKERLCVYVHINKLEPYSSVTPTNLFDSSINVVLAR